MPEVSKDGDKVISPYIRGLYARGAAREAKWEAKWAAQKAASIKEAQRREAEGDRMKRLLLESWAAAIAIGITFAAWWLLIGGGA